MGAIYPTTTKVKTVLTSTETLDAICKAVPIPVNAIGGLNKTNTDVLRGIGIAAFNKYSFRIVQEIWNSHHCFWI